MSKLFDLTGKVALVTGGSRGLGRAMSLAFADHGADVVVTSRKLDACQEVAREIAERGRASLAFACNVSLWDEIPKLVDAAYARFSKVDILVNNAGLSPLAPSSADTSEALFDKIVGVNFKGPFRLTALVGHRMKAGDGGSMINISSIGALRARPEIGPYAGAKAALNAITRSFAFELAPKVRVNTISAGSFLTDISNAWTEEHKRNSIAAMQRSGRPEEIVTSALYFASDASSFTTGANIRVDGGSP